MYGLLLGLTAVPPILRLPRSGENCDDDDDDGSFQVAPLFLPVPAMLLVVVVVFLPSFDDCL